MKLTILFWPSSSSNNSITQPWSLLRHFTGCIWYPCCFSNRKRSAIWWRSEHCQLYVRCLRLHIYFNAWVISFAEWHAIPVLWIQSTKLISTFVYRKIALTPLPSFSILEWMEDQNNNNNNNENKRIHCITKIKHKQQII